MRLLVILISRLCNYIGVSGGTSILILALVGGLFVVEGLEKGKGNSLSRLAVRLDGCLGLFLKTPDSKV